MSTATEIIKSARASLLVPSRPKTPMPINPRHRIRTLRPLGKELNGLDDANIEDLLENDCISSKVLKGLGMSMVLILLITAFIKCEEHTKSGRMSSFFF